MSQPTEYTRIYPADKLRLKALQAELGIPTNAITIETLLDHYVTTARTQIPHSRASKVEAPSPDQTITSTASSLDF